MLLLVVEPQLGQLLDFRVFPFQQSLHRLVYVAAVVQDHVQRRAGHIPPVAALDAGALAFVIAVEKPV